MFTLNLIVMKAIYINPEDIGASGYWSEQWLIFIKKFGYSENDNIQCLLITEIKIEN